MSIALVPNVIERMLRRGGDPHLVYAHSAHTPLSWAVVIEAYDCARALMEAGVEPDLFCAAGLGEVFPGRASEAALVWTDGPKLMPIPENLLASALADLGRGG